MKYSQNHSVPGSHSKFFVLMIASFAATFLLSIAMVSLLVSWLGHS